MTVEIKLAIIIVYWQVRFKINVRSKVRSKAIAKYYITSLPF